LFVTKTDTVVDVSFVLEPGEKLGPGQDGIYHHTRVFSRSALMGEVLVEGGAVNFTANGYNTQHLENVFVNQDYGFVVDPADDLYWFVFENVDGNIGSLIRFTLKERWIDYLLLLPAFITLLILATSGIVLIVMGLRKRPRRMQRGSLKKC